MNKRSIFNLMTALLLCWPATLWAQQATTKPADPRSAQPPATSDQTNTIWDLTGADAVIVGPDGVRARMQVHASGPVRTVTLWEAGRTVTLHENPQGLRVIVAEADQAGRPQTKEYRAKNPEQLKKENPDVFALYERLAKVSQPVGLSQSPVPLIPTPPATRGGRSGPMKELADRQPLAIKFGLLVMDTDAPIKAQFGGGVVVMDMLTNTRASRLGLKPYDLIQKVNDAKIESVDSFEAAIGAKPPVIIELIRNGKSVNLAEK